MAINRVQSLSDTATNEYRVFSALTSNPTQNNVLIATVAVVANNPVPAVTNISQYGVNWEQYATVSKTADQYSVEIWVGTVTSTAAIKNITVNYASYFIRANINVCEYSGLDTNNITDKTRTCNATWNTTYTGQTLETAQKEQLWIGAITTSLPQSTPQNGFTLIDGQQKGSGGNALSLAYLERMVSEANRANSGTTLTGTTNWVGCIATFNAAVQILVKKDGMLSGRGSKFTEIISTADPIIDVESNFGEWDKSAVIENLVITGDGNNTGIRLQDVHSCQIRNVIIKNCKTGIEVKATGNNWCESNNIKHVRMKDVEKGITFTCDNDASFAYTTLDNVLISLDKANGIGIQVGDANGTAQLNGSSIKATCWVNSNNSTGIKIYGQIKNGITNLRLEDASGPSPGASNTIGIGLYSDGYGVYDNHSFFVTYGNLDYVIYPSPPVNNDIKTESL